MIRSLNISVACAVSLYEAYRQKAAAGHYGQQKLPADEYKALRKQWGLYEEATLIESAGDSNDKGPQS
jgi:tRNA (guanosine-2'-O-)-methyltransferase